MGQLRQQQLMRAQMASSAAGAGVADSSGFSQAQGALGSLTFGNISNTNTNTNMTNRVNNFRQEASTWGSIGQLGGQMLSMGYDQVKTNQGIAQQNALAEMKKQTY